MTYQRLPDTVDHQSNQESSSHHHRTSDSDDAPPAYHLERPSLTPAPTPEETTSVPSTFSQYGFDRGWGAMILKLVPDPGAPDYSKGLWGGALRVNCQDVARLMREGFFWSAENILPEEGCMFHATGREWSSVGFHYARTWTLADKSNGENPRWVAQLDIITPDVEKLSRDNVWKARAWNALEQAVYQYDYHRPSCNYKCFYGDKLLQGWWPWPREDGGSPQEK